VGVGVGVGGGVGVGVGDAVGPVQPAAITQKSNTAHTASVAVRFFIK